MGARAICIKVILNKWSPAAFFKGCLKTCLCWSELNENLSDDIIIEFGKDDIFLTIAVAR
jgi:hypothetical protein